MWPILFGCLVPTAVIAYTDYKRHWVPNVITIPMFLTGIAYAVYQDNVADALAGAGVAFLIGFVCFAIGGMGGGDVKFLAGLGAWFGLSGVFPVILLGCLIGVCWGLGKLVKAGRLREWAADLFRGLFLRFVLNVQGAASVSKLPDDIAAPIPREAVPFGTCLALAAWAVWALATFS
ncbi:MAG: prepilin peptidase [Desulforudis sp.]|nr:MAG: prepilin peptidase [Desulforudis sp.]